MADDFLSILKHRRTHYRLHKSSPIPNSEIEEIIKSCILHCPSPFNAQSTRVIVLFHKEHEKFWDYALDAVRPLVSDVQLPATESRLRGFQDGYGTVLFFEDEDVVCDLVKRMPQFAQAFPIWTEHTAGLHHYATWTALDAAGLGCSLQHYNPLVDVAVQQTWEVPKAWTLKAQLVFGSIINPVPDKSYQPLNTRYRTFGM